MNQDDSERDTTGPESSEIWVRVEAERRDIGLGSNFNLEPDDR